MDIQQAWNRLNEQVFNPGEPTPVAIGDLMRHPQNSPLTILRRNAKINMMFAGAFFVIFCVLFVRFPQFYLRLCLGIMMAVYLSGVFFTAVRVKRLPPVPDMNETLLTVMKAYYDQLSAWVGWQQKIALFLYPVAGASGYLLSLATRGNMDALLQSPDILWKIGVAMLVALPMGYWLGRRMTQTAFGQYLDQLKANIDVLEKQG